MTNLANKKAILIADIQKLYENFKSTLDKEEASAENRMKQLQINKFDKEVLNC